MKVRVSYGNSAFNNRITKQEKITVEKLYKKLSTPIIREKKDGGFFIFASFKGSTRNAESVKKYYGTTLDFDDTTKPIRDIKKFFRNYSYLIHTTFNHRAEGKGIRYRLVLPYDSPITAEENSKVTTELMRKIGAKDVDDSSKAMSRLMYLPSCPPQRKKKFRVYKNEKQEYFNAKALLKEINGEAETYVDDLDDDELTAEEKWERSVFVDDTATFKQIGTAEVGNRNEYIYSYACSCFGKNYVYDKALNLCTAKNKEFDKPLSKKELTTTLDSIYKRHKRKNNLQDYRELLSRVETAKNIKTDFPIIIKMVVNSESVLKESERQTLINLLSEKTGIATKTIEKSIKDEKSIYSDDEQKEAEDVFKKNIHVFDNFVYMCCEDRVRDLHKPTRYKTESFARKMSPITKGLKGVPADLTRFLIGAKLLKEADRFSFRPDVKEKFFKDEFGVKCVNSYLKPDITPIAGSIKPVLDHFKNLIPNKTERNHFLNYIAYLIQKPGKKIRWVIILKGAKGIGKSFISDVILQPILGTNNIISVSSKNLTSNFNSWQEGAQLAVCHELKMHSKSKYESKEDLTDILKSFITDNTVSVEKKGVDILQAKNITNLIAFTNHEDVVHLSQDERRYLMLRATMVKPLSEEYYENLAEWVGDNTDKILNYFLNKSLMGFSPNRAPTSTYTKEIKKNSASWPEWVILEAVEDENSFINKHKLVTWQNIVEYVIHTSVQHGMDADMMQSLANAKSNSGHKLSMIIRERGFDYWRGSSDESRMHIFGKRATLYLTPFGMRSKKIITANKARKMLRDQNTVFDFEKG